MKTFLVADATFAADTFCNPGEEAERTNSSAPCIGSSSTANFLNKAKQFFINDRFVGSGPDIAELATTPQLLCLSIYSVTPAPPHYAGVCGISKNVLYRGYAPVASLWSF